MKSKRLLTSALSLVMLGQPFVGMTSVAASEMSEASSRPSPEPAQVVEESSQVDTSQVEGNPAGANSPSPSPESQASPASQSTSPDQETISQSQADSARSASSANSVRSASSSSQAASSSKAEDKLLAGQDILLVIDESLFFGSSEEAKLMSQQAKEIVNQLTSNMTDQNRMMVAYTYAKVASSSTKQDYHNSINPTFTSIDSNSPAQIQKEIDMVWNGNTSHVSNQYPIDQYRQLSRHAKNLKIILLTRGDTVNGGINLYLKFSKNANIKGVTTSVTAVQFAMIGIDKQPDDNFDKNISRIYKSFINQGVEPVVIDPYQYASQREGYLQAILSGVYGSDYSLANTIQPDKPNKSSQSTSQSQADQASEGPSEPSSQSSTSGANDQPQNEDTDKSSDQDPTDQSDGGGNFIEKLIFDDHSDTTNNNQDNSQDNREMNRSWFFYDDDSTTHNSFGEQIYYFITEPVDQQGETGQGQANYYIPDSNKPDQANQQKDGKLPHTGTRRVRKEVYLVAIILLGGGGYLVYRKRAEKADSAPTSASDSSSNSQ